MVVGEFPSFRHLQVFEAVARLENVSRAALEVNMSQPAVTQAVLKVEDWVGRKLFERSSTGTFLLEEGKIFHKRVQRLFDQVEAALSTELFPDAPPSILHSVISRLKSSHVNVFAAAAINGSLDAAVQPLGQSRSTVWRTARDLEHILERNLFDRGSGGAVIGPAVPNLATALTRACLELSEGAEEIALLAGNMRCRLFVGVQRLAHSSLLALTINEVLAAYPDASVKVVEGTYRHLLRQLRGGQIDIMFGPLECPPEITDVVEEPLLQDPYCVVCRRDHPLVGASQITLKDLAKVGWVLPGGVSLRSRAFLKLFRDAEEKPQSCITVDAVSTQISILASSDRVTLLPKYEIALDPLFSGLVVLPFTEQIPRIPDGLTTRANGITNPAQSCFRDRLRTRVEELGILLPPSGKEPRRSKSPKAEVLT